MKIGGSELVKFVHKNVLVITIVFFTIVVLFYFLETTTVIQPIDAAKPDDDLKFVTLSYEELQKHYPHYDPVFDNAQQNKNISTSATAMSSEEIARQLVVKLLEKYKISENENEKINSYQIDNIEIIKEVGNGAAFSVTYSVITNSESTRWSLNHLEKNQWEAGKKFYASFIEENGQFILNIIGPNAMAYYEADEKPDDTVIAANLFAELYLESHLLPQQPEGSRLIQYRIDSVTPYNEHLGFSVIYSVQGIEGKTYWDAGNGEISENGWIYGKSMFVGLRKYGNFYEVFITGP
jgi:hypothetical protein